MKKLRILVSALLVAASVAVWAANPAGAAEKRNSTCSQGLDPSCSPGAGWTEVFIQHYGGSPASWYAVSSQDGNVLTQMAEYYSCERSPTFYWWFRWVNSHALIQFTQDGADGNFHGIGFTGGAFKLQSSATVDLFPYDTSGGNWSFTDYPGVNYFMDSPDQDRTLLWALDLNYAQTHWVVSAAPFPASNSCNTHTPVRPSSVWI